MILSFFTLQAMLCSVFALSSVIQDGSRRVLPGKLVIGYASWSECDEKIITAVQQGVNVVIWFAINLLADDVSGTMRGKCLHSHMSISIFGLMSHNGRDCCQHLQSPKFVLNSQLCSAPVLLHCVRHILLQ